VEWVRVDTVRVDSNRARSVTVGKLRHLVRYPHAPLLARIWAMRENMTAHDGSYVALAERLDIPLMTLDHCLAKAAEKLCEVIVVGE
jgi:predicted nucleic acid-binding protein